MELRKWKALNQERTLQQQRAKLIVQQEFGTSAQPRRVPMSANSECCFPLAAFASSAEAQSNGEASTRQVVVVGLTL